MCSEGDISPFSPDRLLVMEGNLLKYFHRRQRSFAPTISTHFVPTVSMDQQEDGTSLMPVCSQFKISSEGMTP